MGVMLYNSTEGAFKDVQAMQKYNASANAWADCASVQVQENGVWVEKLSVKVYIYGAPNEIVTIKKNGITVCTVQLNSNGVSDSPITLGIGIYNVSSSIGLISYDREVTKDTKIIYAMPRYSLYWKGNQCSDISGGWDSEACTYKDAIANVRTRMTNTGNSFYGQLTTYWSIIYRISAIPIDLTNFNSISMICRFNNVVPNKVVFATRLKSVLDANPFTGWVRDLFFYTSDSGFGATTLNCNIADVTGSYYICFDIENCSASGQGGSELEVYGLWLN